MKRTPSCLPTQASSKQVFLTMKGQFQNLTSGQVRPVSGYDPIRSKCISSEAAWRANAFGAIWASLSPCCRSVFFLPDMFFFCIKLCPDGGNLRVVPRDVKHCNAICQIVRWSLGKNSGVSDGSHPPPLTGRRVKNGCKRNVR